MEIENDKWSIDKTSRHFINLILEDKKQEITNFRRRWKLGANGLPDSNFFKGWKKKVEKECQNFRRKVRVSELEVYFNAGDTLLTHPILSSEMEGRLREQNQGDNLEAVFNLEIRALGSKLRFPSEWDRFLENYVIYNEKIFELIFNRGITISVRYRVNEEYGLIGENICLILGENTGSEDLDNFWKQEIKPLLDNLQARIRDKKRLGKNIDILDEMVRRRAEAEEYRKEFKDRRISSEYKERDRDIALATMKDTEIDKLYSKISPEKEKKLNKALDRKVQNTRHYRKKRNPL